jgi:hypothetical protein
MKESINKLTEKQIALFTLALTVLALVIGIAMPEIRAALGLEPGDGNYRNERSQESAVAKANTATSIDIPTPPQPPGAEKKLALVEIKKDYANSGAQTGEFIVFSGVTFKNTGFLSGKVIIQKGATFKNTGAIEGEVINKGGTFENTGYLDGPLTVE